MSLDQKGLLYGGVLINSSRSPEKIVLKINPSACFLWVGHCSSWMLVVHQGGNACLQSSYSCILK